MHLIWSDRTRSVLAHLLAALLILATFPGCSSRNKEATPETNTAQAPPQQGGPPPSSYSGQGAPFTPQELQNMVSPIALYPDSLIAQMLAASTFPDQVTAANSWMQQNASLTGNALLQAVNQQPWDPSVKALTQFPTVLNNMAQSMQWMSQIGEAYHNQQQQLMAAIQTLRQQAMAAGNLKSTPQQTVSTQSEGGTQVIIIQPANPQVVYVPQYNPTVVYGTPYNPPGYSTADMVATGVISFGVGIAVGALIADHNSCCGWTYNNWSCNWYHGATYYGPHPYYGNAAWHGGYYGGYYNDGYHPYNNGYSNYGYHPAANTAYNNTAYHPVNTNTGYQHYGDTNYEHNTNVSGNTVNVNSGNNSWDHSGWSNPQASHGYGTPENANANRSSAFSGYGSHPSSSSYASSGWGDRSASSRGWSSRGGGGGWGGSRGGFRR